MSFDQVRVLLHGPGETFHDGTRWKMGGHRQLGLKSAVHEDQTDVVFAVEGAPLDEIGLDLSAGRILGGQFKLDFLQRLEAKGS